jgi:SAM-dependent methyltransferase
MKFGLVKRGIQVVRSEGLLVALRKLGYFANVLIVKRFLLRGLDVNSQKYWDTRLRFSWDSVGGGTQTKQFATAMASRVRISELGEIRSILDFGCATGESVPVLQKMFPDARINLFDLSKQGVRKGLKKYAGSFNVVEWDSISKVDLIYTSNVIEHVEDVRAFLDVLYDHANKVIIVQCPWEERHSEGGKLKPERPQGEHIWTVDDSFIELNFDTINWKWEKTLIRVPLAWPGGEQLVLVGVKLGDKTSKG